MVTFWEDPAVEVRRDVVTNVHLSQILIVLHLVSWELDTLLQSQGCQLDCKKETTTLLRYAETVPGRQWHSHTLQHQFPLPPCC